MKWQHRKASSNIEDRRGHGVARGGVGVVGIIVLLVGAYYGVDLSGVVGLTSGVTAGSNVAVSESAEEAERKQFAAVVLAETENAWDAYFRSRGERYVAPTLVLYRDSAQTACGLGRAAMGPFYCPGDRKVYLDLSFYDDMQGQLQAGGDFAFAYVIAHEVGHHVQNLLGITAETQAAQQRLSQSEANRVSVRVELQADCFAGVWAHEAGRLDLLEEGDAEEAFRAAEAVGDDRLQQRSQGRVVPDSFTHGSSAQRLQWFRRGLSTGDPSRCDTFAS